MPPEVFNVNSFDPPIRKPSASAMSTLSVNTAVARCTNSTALVPPSLSVLDDVPWNRSTPFCTPVESLESTSVIP